MLKVGVDESGTHEDAPALCVAACYASATKWKRFVRAWGPTAARYAKRGYHATKGSAEDNSRLAAIMSDTLDGGVAVTINYSDYAALVPHRLRGRLGGEYLSGIRLCVGLMRHLLAKIERPYMALVLEQGHRNQTAAFKYLSWLVDHRQQTRVYSQAWVGKDELLTHPADLASHVYAGLRAGEEHPDLAAVRATVVHRHFERADIADGVQQVKQSLAEYTRLTERIKRVRRGR